MSGERFDTWRQRAALTAVADSVEFLNTAEGAAFLEQLAVYFAPAMIAQARKMSFAIEVNDVVNGAVVLLTENDQRVARYAAASDGEPWGYLFLCLKEWGRHQWGHRGVSLEAAEHYPSEPEADSYLTDLHSVVLLTWELLCPFTPEHLHGDLFELLGWLAANPPQRLSYETDDRVAAHRSAPGFSTEQVTAVMNIAWGGRPRQAETSVFGQYLQDPDFRPSESPSHARALTYYKKQMRAGARASRLLTDWGTV